MTTGTRRMTPVIDSRSTSLAGTHRDPQWRLDCQLTAAEEAEWGRFQTWRKAGLSDAEIRRLGARMPAPDVTAKLAETAEEE